MPSCYPKTVLFLCGLRLEVPIKAVFSLWLGTRKVVPAKTVQQGVQEDVNEKGTSLSITDHLKWNKTSSVSFFHHIWYNLHVD